MSILSKFESWLAGGDELAHAAAFAETIADLPTGAPALAPDATSSNGSTWATAPSASTWRAQSVARQVALSIPAMRRARAAILTPATFALTAWEAGNQLAPEDPRCSFLRQLEPNRPNFNTLALLLDDGLWHDKAVIRATRTVYGTTAYIERIHPQRWTPTYDSSDPDTVTSWRVDSSYYTPDQFAAAGFVAFDFAALGGLRRFGFELLSLYGDLQAAAGRYARAPHPHAILQDAGPSLEDDEITALLDDWDWARENRSTGYLNGMEYKAVGYSAKDLQLTEAREHAALEVARLVQLPAFAVDAAGGDSMTYANIIDRRRDLVAALRPWTTVLTQTLSLNYRPSSGAPAGLLLPRTVSVEFDPSDYLRDDAAARMGVWAAGKDLGIFDEADIRRMEPLARKATA